MDIEDVQPCVDPACEQFCVLMSSTAKCNGDSYNVNPTGCSTFAPDDITQKPKVPRRGTKQKCTAYSEDKSYV